MKSLALVRVQCVEHTAFVDLRDHLFEISTQFSTAVLKTLAAFGIKNLTDWCARYCISLS